MELSRHETPVELRPSAFPAAFSSLFSPALFCKSDENSASTAVRLQKLTSGSSCLNIYILSFGGRTEPMNNAVVVSIRTGKRSPSNLMVPFADSSARAASMLCQLRFHSPTFEHLRTPSQERIRGSFRPRLFRGSPVTSPRTKLASKRANPSIVLKIPEGQGLTQQDIRLLNTEIIKNFKITPSSEIFEALGDADNAILGIHAGGFKSDSLTSLHSKRSRARSRSHIGTRLLCSVKFNIVNHEMKRLGYDTESFHSRKNRVVDSLLDPSWDKEWKTALYEDVKLGMKLSALPRGSSLGLWNFSRNQRLARLSQLALYILAAWIRNCTDWTDLEDVEHSICLQVNPAQTKRRPVPWVDEGHNKRAADQLLPAHAQKRLRQVEGSAVQNIPNALAIATIGASLQVDAPSAYQSVLHPPTIHTLDNSDMDHTLVGEFCGLDHYASAIQNFVLELGPIEQVNHHASYWN
ncbi:hypothetical protein E6O75_ATG08366 [Venturia nashicola]|uniref:Uncharacterized protein n=1 Tax=Venturia nashicola TaxID=86259 RepID=A0A4Z1NHN6_9PEZI|nr:hypothetical protein E6O75_ATG08366 [Venturia nashicola]